MSNRPYKLLSGLILLATVILAVFRTLPPHPLPASAPANEFSAGRAIETVKAIASSPRLVGSPAYEDAQTYLVSQLSALGLETDVQSTTLDGVSVENVLGRLAGSGSTDAILLSAHLDSVSNSPGATDNASGVAAVLETVRALQAETPLRNTVIVLFTGPEENCCYGARAFVSQHPWAGDVRLVINVDAGGLSGPSILSATGPEAGWLVEEAVRTLPDPVGSSAIEALGSPATDYTLEFRPDGLIGFDFNLSWNKSIHSPLDTVENLNPASLQHQGEHMLAMVRHFGNLVLEIPSMPRPIYFDILGLTIIYYPVSWAVYILLGVTVIFAGVLLPNFRQKHFTLRGIGVGVLFFLASLLTVPLLLALIQFAVIQPALTVTPSLASDLVGESLLSNSIRWGSAILAPVTTFLWYVLFRKAKRIKKYDLALGTYLFLYVGAVGTSLAFPELSYLFAWPLIVGLLGTFFWFPSQKATKKQPEWPSSLARLGAGMVAIVLFVPGILIALFSIDIRTIYLVPVFVVALLGFLIPPLENIFIKS